MLPDMDEFQVLDLLKSDQATRAIPIILVSVQDLQRKSYRLRAVDFLTKPIDPDRLHEFLRRFRGGSNFLKHLAARDPIRLVPVIVVSAVDLTLEERRSLNGRVVELNR